MALHLILRNTNKFQGTEIITKSLRNFSAISCFKQFPQISKSAPLVAQCQNKRLMSADHSRLWPIEKGITIGLLALVPAAVAFPNTLLDNIAAAATVVHFHWGLEACVVDYIRPILFGNIIPKLSMLLLYIVSGFTLGGLIYYNVNDIGIGKTVRKIWAIKP